MLFIYMNPFLFAFQTIFSEPIKNSLILILIHGQPMDEPVLLV